jgi:two-component system chemotaxis response regulator CheB
VRVRSAPAKIQPKLTADAVIAGRAKAHRASRQHGEGAGGGRVQGGNRGPARVPGRPCPRMPGIVIVAATCREVTAAFAQRLDGLCRITVKDVGAGQRHRAAQPGPHRPGQPHMCSSAARH